jgi:hypothetical protein
MFGNSEAAKRRAKELQEFEERKISELTVSQFRRLMDQILYDSKRAEYDRSREFIQVRPAIDID